MVAVGVSVLFFNQGSGDDGEVDGEEAVEGHSFCILSDTMSILSFFLRSKTSRTF